MKSLNKNKKSIGVILGLAGLLPAFAVAGPLAESGMVIDTIAEPEFGSAFSGSLSLDANTHFISYGADVWGGGGRWDGLLFNPSLSIDVDLGSGFTFNFGTWWDVNDQAASAIGGQLQEVDIWAGISYSTGIFSVGLTYQQWIYAEQTEEIIDLSFGLDTFLNPSLTIHGRTDAGASGGRTGAVGVLGVSESVDAGPVTIDFPVSVAFSSDGFHAGGGSAGYAFASAGVQASLPLSFISPAYGDWSLNTGVTYYNTSTTNIPGNRDDNFVTGNFGVSISF